ncbi:MAG TPA: APC family permease [Terriglobales bacterium]|nr:APC family permease [Terriglobales bacterium]
MTTSPSPNDTLAAAEQPHLRRLLTIKDLVFFGIVLIQPIAPVGIFGLAQEKSHGHVAATIIIGMVAMMLTAFSFGRMAALYPSAGSAYTYVSRGLGARLGFVAGWSMSLGYLIIPLVNTAYCALTLERVFPGVPYAVWAVLFVVLITTLNLRRISATAHTNTVLLAVMTVVIVGYVGLAIKYLIQTGGWGGLLSYEPFYTPGKFELRAIGTATSVAALTYIGFDGVTTLAEEVHEPKRSVPIAVVLVCFLTGVFSTIEVYLAQLVWPDYTTFTNSETAFLDVTHRIGGPWLFQAMGWVLVVACLGTGLTGQAGAARLLYGMGRENVLPRAFFGHLSPSTRIPNFNVILIAVLTLAAIPFVDFELAATVLVFGAFVAFMGVNLAAIRENFFRRRNGQPKIVRDLVVPGLGFLICLAIWLSLPTPAKIGGGAWLILGLLFDGIKSRGFRVHPVQIDFSET